MSDQSRQSTTVECETLFGKLITLPRAKLTFRPSVYAIILRGDKVLLLNTRSTGKYSLPGGGVDVGESMEEALHREVREETGLKIAIDRFAGFREQFFYYDPGDEAYHSFLFFYVCRPLTLDLLENEAIYDGEVESPQWINAASIRADDLQSHGELILEILTTAVS
jgi:8-oxo-dGTP pyrophosphatase MutT (NUDIX family)